MLFDFLNKEFNWLIKNYPIHVEHVVLKLFKDIERDAFAFYEVETGELGICFFVTEKLLIDEADEIVHDLFQVPKDEHLYFWMLYHEYGHLLDMGEIYKKSGMDGLEKQMETYGDRVDKILNQMDFSTISQKEGQQLYRELAHEKKADEFAYSIFSSRREKINQYISQLNNKNIE